MFINSFAFKMLAGQNKIIKRLNFVQKFGPAKKTASLWARK